MSVCLLCGDPIEDSPFSVCYDPEWEHNVWGGDTHETIGLLCSPCGEKVAPVSLRKIRKELDKENQYLPIHLPSVKEIMAALDRPSPLGSDRKIAKILQAKGVRPMMTPDDCVEAMFG